MSYPTPPLPNTTILYSRIFKIYLYINDEREESKI